MREYGFRNKAEKLTQEKKKSTRRSRMQRALAAVVAVATVYGLLVPANTLTKSTYCGLEEHTHSQACYELTCGLEEGAGHQHSEDCYAEEKVLKCGKEEAEAHHHDAACYETDRELTCGKEEIDGHTHSDKCYKTERELICGLKEAEGHTHSDACYNEDGELTCGIKESEGHSHSDACYRETEKLVCGKEEREGHSHSDACYTETQKLVCKKEESEGHTHTDACYDVKKVLTCSLSEGEAHQHSDACYTLACGKPEHTHTAECYNNARADVENEKIWKQTLPVFKDDESALQRFVAVAVSQLGYKESLNNYEITDDIQRGITRYGQWFGKPYADWDGMFVQFCLYYAGIEPAVMEKNSPEAQLIMAIAKAEDTAKLAEAFAKAGSFVTGDALEGYVPDAGQIIFFKDAETEVITAGIVYEVNEEKLNMEVILGNAEDAVRQVKFALDEADLYGYGVLPEVLKKAEGETEPEATLPVVDPLESLEETTPEKTTPGEATPEDPTAEEPTPEEPAESQKIMEYTGATDTVTVRVEAPEGALPDGTVMEVTPVKAEDVMDAVTDVVENEIVRVDAVDITFYFNGEKIEPALPVRVFMQPAAAVKDADEPVLVHVDDDGNAEKVEPVDPEKLWPEGTGEPAVTPETAEQTTLPESPEQTEAASETSGEIIFESDSFSVYALVYTVDFHWEVDGKTYDFSIPGGGFVSFYDLIEALGIGTQEAKDEGSTPMTFGEAEVSENTRKFVADVENVEFSTPGFVDVSKVDADTTVGQIKESRGLECEYSADLTEEQIAEINGTLVESGDWALISVQPFTSEETLTVTMKNGEVFTICVTDYQISTNVLTADGKNYKITVTFDDDAQIPSGTKLVAEEIEPGTDEYLQHLGKAWTEVNKEYLEKEQLSRINNSGLADDYEGEEIHPVNLDNVRFFDIRLESDGEEVEPKAPVKVEIRYEDGFPVSETEKSEVGVVHFRKEDTELINDVETEVDTDGNLTGFRYMQDSFSDIGTFVGQETTDDTASVAGRIAYPKLSAMLRASSSGPLKEELGEPAASKTLEDNEDGTYTLTLSVTGAAKKKDEQPKANVLFVMDRSSSMSNSNNDIYMPYTGDPQSGTTYYGTNDGTNYFTLNYSNGQYTYNDYIWPFSHDYTGTVYTRVSRLKAEQDAMSLLFKDLLDNNKDESGSYTKDNVEISVISFADDRGKMNEGTEYPRNGSANGWTSSDYTGLMSVVNNTNTPSGTNWQDALQYAKEVADAKKAAQPDEQVFVIFLTDGEPTAIAGESGGAHHYNNVGGGFIAAYTPARPDAKALVDAGYGFYSIFTFNPGEEQTRYLKRLVHYAYTGYDASDTTAGNFSYLDSSEYVDKYFYNADSPENLASAFDDILSAITTTIAHGNVSIVDGLTTDAMTSTLVDGKANGFTYKVTDENGNVLYTVTAAGDTDDPSVTFKINGTTYSGSQVVQKEAANGKKYYSVTADGKEYKMALADFVDTGEGDEETKELTWDLSPIGTLTDKYTYSVEFVVWPNQEAYDYVAALNNGLMEWDKTTQTPVYDKDGDLIYYKNGVEEYPSIVLDPDTGVYSVLTNTKQELEYSIVSTTNGVETTEGPYTVELDTPDPMDLKASASALEKVWNINRDPSILYKYLYEMKDENDNPVPFDIGFIISQDGERYKDVHLPGAATVTEDGVSYDWSAYDEDDLVEYNGKTFSKRWSQAFSIPTGLMLSTAQMEARGLDKSQYTSYTYSGKTYYVLEEGHDFQVNEPEMGYEFDFDAPTYHPMLVDGVLMDVKFAQEGGTKHISGMEELEIDTDTGKSALSVFNTLRGYINVKKKVVDTDGTTQLDTDDTEFTFQVTLTNPRPVFEGDSIPWYGINGLYYHDEDGNYYQAEYLNGELQVTTEEGGPYPASGSGFDPDVVTAQTVTYTVNGEEKTVTISGNQMTPGDGNETDGYKQVTAEAKITQTETLYIANVPVNTTYSIQEIAEAGYGLIRIDREVGASGSASGAGSLDTGIVEGRITPNTETLLTYTNKCLVTDITVQKTDASGKGLKGAVFQLKKVAEDGASESDASAIDSVTGLTEITKTVNGETVTYSSAFESDGGIQTIHGLPDGTYRLYEVVIPEGYIGTYRYIQFEVENRSIKNVTTDTEDTSKLDTTANGIDIKIANEPGAALPNTGGRGTALISIIGMLMVLAAGTVLFTQKIRKN